MELLTHEDFAPHVGTGFTIHTNERDEVLTLTEVDVGKQYLENGRQSFALLFSGSSNDLMFNSQMVWVDHAEMGRIEIMISPFGRNDDGTVRYEAVFG